MSITQKDKAELFLAQHKTGKLLLLPNVWDPLSARLVASLGFPSLATASVATALIAGYDDGQLIPFAELIAQVRRISSAVDLPLSVDVERGFSESLPELKDHVAMLLEAGAIGVNLEDGTDHGRTLTPVDVQCRKIEAVREAAIKAGIPLVINARTDLFIPPPVGGESDRAIERAVAYASAGADCFYPVLVKTYDDVRRLTEGIRLPLNVTLLPPVSDLRKLETLGVARVSVGPQLLKAGLAKMKAAAEGLLMYEAGGFFDQPPLTSEWMEKLL